MTDPDGGSSVPPSAPQGRAQGPHHDVPGVPAAAPATSVDDDLGPDRLAPREEALIEGAVTAVGRSGRGPVVVTVLVVAAFLLGLFRPWDLLGPAASIPTAATPAGLAASADGSATASGDAPAIALRTPPPAPRTTLTCALPLQWRSSTIEDWTGRQARVWKAVEMVEASAPDDPRIPFEPIVSPTVTAIGWCAPVDGPERPPENLATSLFRIKDGIATPVPYDRLEPAEPDALGELWVPTPRSVGFRPAWPMGRYVIELRSPSGGYVRYLGLDLTDRIERPSAEPSVRPSASPLP